MSAHEWAGFAAGITTTLIGILAGFRWLVRGWLNELLPNSGKSLKDQVTRLEQRLDELFIVITRK
jgi:hypothetical protein